MPASAHKPVGELLRKVPARGAEGVKGACLTSTIVAASVGEAAPRRVPSVQARRGRCSLGRVWPAPHACEAYVEVTAGVHGGGGILATEGHPHLDLHVRLAGAHPRVSKEHVRETCQCRATSA